MGNDNKKYIVISLFALVIIFIATTYGQITERIQDKLLTNILRIDEEAYGSNVFNSLDLDFKPILDKNRKIDLNNVINISFWVGGSELNTEENIIYDIALADLKLDCELLSSYLKWELYKNGELLSDGSLDYKFDTIKKNRLVLTEIQEDLKSFSADKRLYDYYEFYMWISDSCQEEDIDLCLNKEDQSSLVNKRISGRIEVELYGGAKKVLERKPTEELDVSTCRMKEGEDDGQIEG